MKYTKYLFSMIQLLCIMFIITKAVQFVWWIVHPVKSSIQLLNAAQNYDKIEQHVINFVPFGEVKIEVAQTSSVISNINLYGTYVSDEDNSMAFVNVESKAYILQIGDEIQKYSVKKIESQSIELYDPDSKLTSTVKLSQNKNAVENTSLTNSGNMNNNNDGNAFNQNNISSAVSQFVSNSDTQNGNSSEPKIANIMVHKRRS